MLSVSEESSRTERAARRREDRIERGATGGIGSCGVVL